jgi:hypothetical protein
MMSGDGRVWHRIQTVGNTPVMHTARDLVRSRGARVVMGGTRAARSL